MQFVVFEKIYECLFIPNCIRKIIWFNLLIIYKEKFLHANWWKRFEMVEQKERTRITQSGKNCVMNCAIQGMRLIWKQKIWLAICEFLFRNFPSINLISSFCTQFQLSALISSFCTQKISCFCTVWDKLTCSQPNTMEKFFHVYYYNSKYFRAQSLMSAPFVVWLTLLWMSPQQKIEKKGLLMCITRTTWWLKSGMGYFILRSYCTFSVTSILQPKSVWIFY